MSKRRSYDRLFEGNILVVYCVLFTANIIFLTILSTLQGGTIILSIELLMWHFTFLSAPLLPLTLFKYLWQSNYIDEKKYLFLIGIPIHYLLSAGLTILLLFVQGIFFGPFPLRLHLINLLNYTVVYGLVIAGAMIIDFMQTSKANKNLRIIQESIKKERNV